MGRRCLWPVMRQQPLAQSILSLHWSPAVGRNMRLSTLLTTTMTTRDTHTNSFVFILLMTSDDFYTHQDDLQNAAPDDNPPPPRTTFSFPCLNLFCRACKVYRRSCDVGASAARQPEVLTRSGRRLVPMSYFHIYVVLVLGGSPKTSECVFTSDKLPSAVNF